MKIIQITDEELEQLIKLIKELTIIKNKDEWNIEDWEATGSIGQDFINILEDQILELK